MGIAPNTVPYHTAAALHANAGLLTKVRPWVKRHTVSRDSFMVRTSGVAPLQACQAVLDA
jgi:hypothetical protein